MAAPRDRDPYDYSEDSSEYSYDYSESSDDEYSSDEQPEFDDGWTEATLSEQDLIRQQIDLGNITHDWDEATQKLRREQRELRLKIRMIERANRKAERELKKLLRQVDEVNRLVARLEAELTVAVRNRERATRHTHREAERFEAGSRHKIATKIAMVAGGAVMMVTGFVTVGAVMFAVGFVGGVLSYWRHSKIYC